MKAIDISFLRDTEKDKVLEESKLLEALSHPNIVRFIEVYKTKNGKLCIVMEYAHGKAQSFLDFNRWRSR